MALTNLASPVNYNITPVDFSPIADAGLDIAQGQRRDNTIKQAQELFKAGDMDAIGEFAIANPELGKQMFEMGGIRDEAAQQRMTGLSKELTMSQSPVRDLKSYIAQGEAAGRDMTHSKKMLENSGGDPEQLKKMSEMSWAASDPSTYKSYRTTQPKEEKALQSPAAVRETEWFMQQTPEVQEKHLEVKRKTNPTMAEALDKKQKESDIKVGEAGRVASEKGKAGRAQGFIDSGIEAADSLANISRASQLLNDVKTGGIDSAMLKAKRMFGIESANEAELSAGLGKAILSQLKPIFGAAFTAAEGERLEAIEANFGKSTEGNKRLLEQVKKITDRAARRGLKAAEKSGDEFTASEIRQAMEFDLGADEPAQEPEQQQYTDGTVIRNPSTGATMIMKNGEWVNG